MPRGWLSVSGSFGRWDSWSLRALQAVEKCATQNQRAQENEMKVVLGERRAETEISGSGTSEEWGGAVGKWANKKICQGQYCKKYLHKAKDLQRTQAQPNGAKSEA